MPLDLNGIPTVSGRSYVWDSTVLTWIAETQPGSGGAGSSQVTVSKFLDSSNAAWAVADSANNALRVNVVAGAAGGSTAITISRVQDSSNTGLAVGDSANNAIRVNVVAGAAGGSTIVTVSSLPMVSTSLPAATSSGLNVWVVGGARQNIGSTAADNAVQISGNSTVIQGTTPWVIGGNSSVRANLSSTAADNPVQISGNSTVIQGTSPWVIGGNSSVRANLSSTAADNPVQISGNSTAIIQGNSTVIQGTSPWLTHETHSTNVSPSSASTGAIVRQVIDQILTTASSNAFASTAFTVQSSGAGLRSYVTAYSILSTNAGPTKVKFYQGSTMLWPVIFAAVSSAVSGANLAVGAPAYLFRTASAKGLTLNVASSVAGFQVAVSYFRAP